MAKYLTIPRRIRFFWIFICGGLGCIVTFVILRSNQVQANGAPVLNFHNGQRPIPANQMVILVAGMLLFALALSMIIVKKEK